MAFVKLNNTCSKPQQQQKTLIHYTLTSQKVQQRFSTCCNKNKILINFPINARIVLHSCKPQKSSDKRTPSRDSPHSKLKPREKGNKIELIIPPRACHHDARRRLPLKSFMFALGSDLVCFSKVLRISLEW